MSTTSQFDFQFDAGKNPSSGSITAQQLAEMDHQHQRLELVKGVLQMMAPAGSEHGRIASRILVRLATHVEQFDLGETYAAETGFLIERNPDTVRAPDAAFLSHQALEVMGDVTGFLPTAPELLVEVVSPNDSFSAVESKARQWLDAGTQVVIVADPENKTLRAYYPDKESQMFGAGDVFEAGDVCRGWKLEVDDVFRSRR